LAAGVKTLIDVRDFPCSRRAGFSKGPLSASLAADHIDYLHLKALGTPAEGREANRTGRMEIFWKIVETQLAKPEAEHDLALAATIAAEAPACLLCLERDHRTCHRSRVAEMIAKEYGFAVEHLVPTDPAF
jgi:uncharacterized protein (DUF488 family)